MLNPGFPLCTLSLCLWIGVFKPFTFKLTIAALELRGSFIIYFLCLLILIPLLFLVLPFFRLLELSLDIAPVFLSRSLNVMVFALLGVAVYIRGDLSSRYVGVKSANLTCISVLFTHLLPSHFMYHFLFKSSNTIYKTLGYKDSLLYVLMFLIIVLLFMLFCSVPSW